MSENQQDEFQQLLFETKQQIEALQIEQSFQEKHISDLQDAMFEQQKQLLVLQKENRFLSEELKKIKEADSSHEVSHENEKPPHY